MTKITHLTIHCAATPEGRANTAAEISKWDQDRFGQISYHWVVELDGKKVRTLPDHTRGAHVGKRNTGNIGVCYVGGVAKGGDPKDTRTLAQRNALRELVAHYRSVYPGIIVLGHRDWPGVAKACPSFDVATKL